MKKKHNDSVGAEGFLNRGEVDEMKIVGFKEDKLLNFISCSCMVLTLGVVRLIFHWWPELNLYTTHRKCSLSAATKCLIIDTYEKRFRSIFVKEVKILAVNKDSTEDYELSTNSLEKFQIHLADGSNREASQVRVVRVKKHSYVWISESQRFVKLIGLDNGIDKNGLFAFAGCSTTQREMKHIVYGLNSITVPVTPISNLIFLEVLSPFYFYQLFAVTLWLFDGYYYYCLAILIMSLFGISASVIQTHSNQKRLYDTVNSSDVVSVKRSDGTYEEISTTELVPGDIITIPPHGCTVHCDAVLLNGNCIVNESLLTGESVPVTKTPIVRFPAIYNSKDDSLHTLFCGTTVIQTRSIRSTAVHALVIRTGFLTAKGNIVRSILYPPPADYKFDRDSHKFIWVLASMGVIGLAISMYLKVSRGMGYYEILVKSLDLMTIAIPAALPGSMTVGKIYALARLKKWSVSCVNSRVVNVSGSLNCVCFDKTGTLTEDGLDLWGVIPAAYSVFDHPLRRPTEIKRGHFLFGLASCHSLTIVNNQITGDPLDLKMFESTNWILEEPGDDENSKVDQLVPTIVRSNKELNCDEIELGVLHQFQFSSKLQRMSVVTRQLGDPNLILYCKGSPEMLVSLCKRDSVPLNLASKLREYTEKGYRVIAMAWRELENISFYKLDKTPREELEKDLNFSGLIVFENKLKPQTIPTISILKGAKIKLVMITGDNIQTAISVARESGILGSNVVEISGDGNSSSESEFIYNNVDDTIRDTVGGKNHRQADFNTFGGESGQIAITGTAWEAFRIQKSDQVNKLVEKTAVYARMTSEQKQQVILELQSLGYVVAMCGDGANDCSALKAANVGISLSEAEASVASPFTSQIQNISCVLRVVREGRAALVTSFGIFKLMVLYSFTEFFSTLFLYTMDTNLTDFQFLFIDVLLAVNFAFSFGRTQAYKGPITQQTPLPSMMHIIPITSLVLIALTTALFQIISIWAVHQFSWFQPFVYTTFKTYASYENFAVFTISQFQYITFAVVFSEGPPFRERIYTNKIFFAIILLMTAVCAYITLCPSGWIIKLLQFRFPPSMGFPAVILALATANFLCCMFLDSFVVNHLMLRRLKCGLNKREIVL